MSRNPRFLAAFLASILPVGACFAGLDPVQPDPRTGDNFNRYHYASNNPYAHTDPDGRFPVLVPIVFGIAAYATSNYANAPGRGEPTMSMSPMDQAAAALPPARLPTTLRAAANIGDARYTSGARFSRSTKQAAAERASSLCEYCSKPTLPARKSTKGVSPPKDEAATDHIVPRSKGGTNGPDNAAHACRECNTQFSDRPKPHPRENP